MGRLFRSGRARTALRDPRVEVGVLEVARGGILRRGLGLPHATAAAVTNLGEDHLGDYGINTVTVVMNNGCWGAEKAYQRDFFDERYIGANVSSPPFDKLAELYGAKGYRTETLSQTAEAIEAALQCGKPAVIDVMVDPAALYSFRRDSFKHRGG